MDKIVIKIADVNERDGIYKLRHTIYAVELGQHKTNPEEQLKDSIDDINTYIIAKIDDQIAGFVSITPPGGSYGLDKYVSRDEFPFIYDNMYEGRLFSVLKPYRTTNVALLLFFGVLRFVESRKGDRIMTIGREDLVDFYEKTGLINLNKSIISGAVEFKLLYALVTDIRKKIAVYENILKRIKNKVDWQLDFPMIEEKTCYHGGAFFNALGHRFETLEKSDSVISADVLDAWFSPADEVIQTLTEYLPFALRTSPPTYAEGLVEAISEYRGVNTDCILTGAGSSALIYQVFPHIVHKTSKVLIIEPSYGEYAHILEEVIGCQVTRMYLSRQDGYVLNIEELEKKLKFGFDLVVLINPNNPTGIYTQSDLLQKVMDNAPAHTLFWIDETYIEYAGLSCSLEKYAAQSENCIVCKSMSKVYALSGVRSGYIVTGSKRIQYLKKFSPPWAVSLPAQIASVKALENPEYYRKMYDMTAVLRQQLHAQLENLGLFDITTGVINSILCHCKPGLIQADTLVEEARKSNLFIRNVISMNKGSQKSVVRISVKSQEINEQIISILKNIAGKRV